MTSEVQKRAKSGPGATASASCGAAMEKRCNWAEQLKYLKTIQQPRLKKKENK